MGTVIAKTAAADDIVGDAQITHEQGVARGGRIQEIVEDRLGTSLPLIVSVRVDWRAATETVVTARAERDAKVAKADAVIAECSDSLWNRVGRPANDPKFRLVFPDGVAGYVEGEVEGLPSRMSVLIDLLGRGLHPKLTPEVVGEWVPKLIAARDEAARAIAATTEPLARATMLERSYYSLVRSLHSALAATKRDFKSDGMTEAQIHEIIPDRPRASAKPSTPSSPSAPTAQPTASNGAGDGSTGPASH